MNYLTEILAFYNWLGANPLSTSAIVLWHALMSVANGSKWSHEITPAMSTLESKTGLGRDGIITARNRLSQAGLIECHRRNGRQSSVYILKPFVSAEPTQSPTQTPPQIPAQLPPKYSAQSPTIYKQKETKQNNSFSRTRKSATSCDTSYDLTEVEAMLNRITF